jgi:YD repeat-containing protein
MIASATVTEDAEKQDPTLIVRYQYNEEGRLVSTVKHNSRVTANATDASPRSAAR